MEVTLDKHVKWWMKASRSNKPNEPQCVEVGPSTNAVGVRTSRNRDYGELLFPISTWVQFRKAAAVGMADLSVTRLRKLGPSGHSATAPVFNRAGLAVGQLNLADARWRCPAPDAGLDQNVEIAFIALQGGDTYVAMRNSSQPHGLVLTFDHGEWMAFIDGIKANEFSRVEEEEAA
jgi:Domain of unknown function (DUF397)